VTPVVLAAELLEVLLEQGTHGDNAVSHILDLTEPLLVQCRIVQDFRGNARAMDRGIGVKRSDENLDLGVYALLLLCRFANDGESTNTLTIETLRIVSYCSLRRLSNVVIPCSWRSSERAQGGDPP